MDAVDELGLADNTIMVYSSDHGGNLFNHQMVQKHCFFETAVGVPLILRFSGTSRPGTGRWKYVRSRGDLHQLYDLENDPHENVNLIDDPAHGAIAAGLDARVCRDWIIPDMSQVPNVVFTCGAVEDGDGSLNIYYAGADRCVCLATARTQDLVDLCLE